MRDNDTPATGRRPFLKAALAASAGSALAHRARALVAAPIPIPQVDVKIRRAAVVHVRYRRPRLVAGNSQYRVAGEFRGDTILAAFGDNGQVGIGPISRSANPAGNAFLAPLIGRKLADVLGPLRRETAKQWGTTAFWDLAGKTMHKPVYALFGGHANPAGVPVYDGSIYMEELIDRDGQAHKPSGPNWETMIREALDSSRREGHRFVKVKIGRGAKHLSREAGNLQDLAVLEYIRGDLGPEWGIGVDANNGYTPPFTRWLLEEAGGLNLAFVEEMFPEDSREYLTLKEFILARGLKTLVADGETWRTADEARPFVEAGAIDLLQGDMVQFQFEGILEEAAIARASGARIAPHNWGSEFGFYMQCQLGLALDNFYRAECDPGREITQLVIKHGYKIADGLCQVPDYPGLGVELNLKEFEKAELVANAEA